MPGTELAHRLRTTVSVVEESCRSGLPVEEVRAQRAERGLTRRALLRRAGLVGAGAMLASASPAWLRYAEAAVGPRVVIVGGGSAGLTAAYRLRQAGCVAELHEASNRLGGRCWTRRNYFADGQITEHGAELIDTGHHATRKLARQLGLKLDDLLADQDPEDVALYYFDGQPYTDAQAEKDYREVRPKLKADLDAAPFPTLYFSNTKRGREIDNMSLTEYIDAIVPGGRKSKFGQLLEICYEGEYGGDAEVQSGLNLLYLLGFSTKNFEILGESDERFHIRGGTDLLTTRLAEKLPGQITMESELVAIERKSNGKYALSFKEGGPTKTVTADRVILALPFSIMRSSVDFSKAGFKNLKKIAIREQGMGTNSKLMVQFTNRYWRTLGNTGETFSDRGYGTTWESSRVQPGNSGLLNGWNGGTDGVRQDGPDQVLAQRFLAQIEPVLPGISARYNGRAKNDHWPSYPWTKGSYSFLKVGQYQRFSGVEREVEGACHFAGEHTSIDFPGWLEGGVESGERAAEEVASALGLTASAAAA
jgi:monoamine oxidase